jgi:hypothetical protein
MLAFGKMRGSGWWPNNAHRRKVTVAGVDPVAAGVVGALERAQARGMAGRSGAIRAGNSLSPSYGYKGYLPYTQLALLRTVGASTNLRGSPNVALPGTVSGRVGAPGSSVADSLAAIPPGYR